MEKLIDKSLRVVKSVKLNLIIVSDLKFNNDKLCKVKTVHSAASSQSVSSCVPVALAGLDSNTDESPQADTPIGMWSGRVNLQFLIPDTTHYNVLE